jgi:hypothetical protein
MSHTENDPTSFFCDNTSTTALSKNYVFHKKSKHIDTHFHFIRELVNNGEITFQYRIIGKFGEIRNVERGQVWHL